MEGEISGSWDQVIDDKPRSEAEFNEQLVYLVVGKLGMNAHKNQAKYLRSTKKPRNTPVKEWFKRIRFINRILVIRRSDGEIR